MKPSVSHRKQPWQRRPTLPLDSNNLTQRLKRFRSGAALECSGGESISGGLLLAGYQCAFDAGEVADDFDLLEARLLCQHSHVVGLAGCELHAE